MTNNIKFQPPKGMRDISGNDAVKLNRLLAICREVFEKYGFEFLETPALENFEVLTAKGGYGEAARDEIYYFKDKSGRELGLRFDFTVPLARFVASNPNIPKPYRRYTMGKVWRYDNPQALRWREFWQADVDIIGSSSPVSDAECVACVCEILQRAGFPDFEVRVNNRRILESLLLKSGVSKEKTNEALRSIDKMGKIGKDGVEKELDKKGMNGKKIITAINISGSDVIKELEKYSPEGLDELLEFLKYCKGFGIEEKINVDVTLARGLDYYTSLVFEISLPKQKLSFGAGGRYDNLIKTLGGPDLPATGISLGIDRLIAEIGDVKDSRKIFVATIGEVMNYAIAFSQKLRKAGIPCEMEISNRRLGKQLDYASGKYRYVIIIGEKESRLNKAKLRDMETGEEKLLAAEDLIKIMKGK